MGYLTRLNISLHELFFWFFSTKRIDNSNSRLVSQVDKETGKYCLYLYTSYNTHTHTHTHTHTLKQLWKIKYLCFQICVKGIVHPKKTIVSFSLLHVVLNLYDCFKWVRTGGVKLQKHRKSGLHDFALYSKSSKQFSKVVLNFLTPWTVFKDATSWYVHLVLLL